MSQLQERRHPLPTVIGRRVAVAALLYARIGEDVELVRYRAARDGFLPELVTGALVGCTRSEWILMVGGVETRYSFSEWEFCIGAESDGRADAEPAKDRAERSQRARSITVGQLRSPCRAVRTQYVNDPAVTDIRILSPSSRTGKRTCSICGARRVTMLQTLRRGEPIQAWQYTRHFPPLPRISDRNS